MKKHLFAAALIAGATFAVASAKDADPVLMTVDGQDVRVSEFEYLYNKNNTQQAQRQTLDEYLQMFIDYKLKVADALHAGLQNKPEFVSEYARYRADLASPYLRKPEIEDSLVNEAYRHTLSDVYVSHIMMPASPAAKHALDSIRTLIVNGASTFEAEAARNSIDKQSAVKGGRMGYVIPGRFPWAFEKASYDTPKGEISPVVNSGMGYHIIRVESVSPSAGEVEASHILRLTQGKTPEQIAAQKALIDSIYTVLGNGADFAEIATKYSEDPGSASRGGSLGYFSRGMMVQEFDSVSFALPDGAISKPFTTSFGYHIVKRTGHKDVLPLEEMRGHILEAIHRDERANAATDARLAELMAQYGAKINDKAVAEAKAIIAAAGALDSTTIAAIAAIKEPVGTYSKGKVSFADFITTVSPTGDVHLAAEVLDNAVDRVMREAVLSAFRDDLATTDADYRNLLNEYHNGILLYEISNEKVWDRAAKDREGLEAFFKANADKYGWEQPKFKSYIIFATGDSLLNEAVKYAGTLSTDDAAEFVKEMRTRFGRDIKIERVIAAKGENAITDYLAFGGEKPAESTSKWKHYAAFKGRVIDAPEEAADVRGAAVTDYQSKLDADWVADLHKKYKVKVNKKVFNSLKKNDK
ncbi:MAG: peptidylprolyl isomerase [Muribaculaceae bacterium]|nr:peptidylprolyl isomerase [Muribaculaceae bacterium]